MYNPYESSWLDHQRLRVPKWRKWLEFLSFAILLSLFIATLAGKCFSPIQELSGLMTLISEGA